MSTATSGGRPRVVVVGGGLAGLSAGLEAADRGAAVTLLERRPPPRRRHLVVRTARHLVRQRPARLHAVLHRLPGLPGAHRIGGRRVHAEPAGRPSASARRAGRVHQTHARPGPAAPRSGSAHISPPEPPPEAGRAEGRAGDAAARPRRSGPRRHGFRRLAVGPRAGPDRHRDVLEPDRAADRQCQRSRRLPQAGRQGVRDRAPHRGRRGRHRLGPGAAVGAALRRGPAGPGGRRGRGLDPRPR